MALELNEAPDGLMTAVELDAWQGIPASIIGDELNRSGIMDGGIKPLGPGMAFAGQALTVRLMVGDNSAMHYALTVAWPGAVIVADARGHTDTAVWGEIMHRCAKAQGIAAVVIDGSVRDAGSIRISGLPAFARGAVPLGPHKGWGGAINVAIQCGGIPVSPGDMVIGDDDGVAVVRPEQQEGLLERCQARLARETELLARVDAGELTATLLNLPPAEKIGR